MAGGDDDAPARRAPPPPPEPEGARAPETEGPPPLTAWSFLPHLLLFLGMQAYKQYKGVVPPAAGGPGGGVVVPASPPDAVVVKPIGVTDLRHRNAPAKPTCLWPAGTVMDLDVAITDAPRGPPGWPPLTTTPAEGGAGREDDGARDRREGTVLATWRQEGLILGGVPSGDSDRRSILSALSLSSHNDQDMNRRNATLTLPLTPPVWNNETHVYAHVRLRRRVGAPGGVLGRASGREDVLVKRIALTRHRKRKKVRDVKNLLDAAAATNASVEVAPDDDSVLTAASLDRTEDRVLLYLKPSLTLQLVDLGPVDFSSRDGVPKQIAEHMDWLEEEGDDGRGGTGAPRSPFYYPVLYGSDFWITYASLKEVNGTLKESTVEVTVEPVPVWKWQLQTGTQESWSKQDAFTGEEDEGNDVIKNMLLDTNPYLLAVTAIVSLLHTVFDMLAFKNDVSFFKNKKSMEGISLRSMVINAASSVVILLYLADNDTSFMVLMSNGVGLAIEAWKISKAVTVSFEGGKVEWVEAQSYKNSKTKEYDEIATSHLLYVTMPLVAGYGVYSLLYQQHRGWYSWILNTLVGFIYMFGFVMMTPQLFINYKLQSVAHINFRTMCYKSINTFIDDLFAFVIKMPIMHRLACLRDDLIFFVYLFQRYKYRTDYTRVNEFGQCARPTEDMLAEREREVAAAASDAGAVDRTGPPVAGAGTKRRGARDKQA